MDKILYLCNGKKECGKRSNLFCGVCSFDKTTDCQCFYTTDPNYALNGPMPLSDASDRFEVVNDCYIERMSYVKD